MRGIADLESLSVRLLLFDPQDAPMAAHVPGYLLRHDIPEFHRNRNLS